MKLSAKELEILAACETEAELTFPAIAKRTGTKEHVVRRALDTLTKKGVIRRRAYINSFLLGTAPYLLAFALNTDGKRQRRKLLEYLQTLREVSYFSEVGGRFNIFTEIRFRSVHQIQSFLDQLSLEFGNVFEEKEILALTSMSDLPTLAKIKDRPRLREFATSISSLTVDLQELDLQILQSLSQSFEESNTRIAKRLNIPLSTFEYHVKRLEKIGLILGSRYQIDLSLLGLTTFNHLVSARGFHPALREKMLDFARHDPAVHCFRTFIGAWDFLFECHYQSSEESIEFVERLDAAHGADIDWVESVPVLKHGKVSDCTVPHPL